MPKWSLVDQLFSFIANCFEIDEENNRWLVLLRSYLKKYNIKNKTKHMTHWYVITINITIFKVNKRTKFKAMPSIA